MSTPGLDQMRDVAAAHATDPHVQHCARALRYYAGDLDATW